MGKRIFTARGRATGRRATMGLGLVAALVAGSALTSMAAAGLADHGGATLNRDDKSKSVRASIDSGKAQNVILLIGDGMGDSEKGLSMSMQ